MTIDGFYTFLGIYLGTSILGIGTRHLMRRSPTWSSQLGKNRLFEKITTDLYRLWFANFVAYTHRDTLLFKKSIIEQRIRFYGVEELNNIIYSNTRRSRDPPAVGSGDERITRMYSKRTTDIRMRTSKKNESGLLDQSICSSNEGYKTWKEGDPKGSGITFASVIYPGAKYNRGSAFREKDMGNLIQLLFTCEDYFRYRNFELVTDSHFGHLVPIAFLRMWGVYATSSFNPKSRIGVSNLLELSKKKSYERR